jgi:hypothetical protein
MDVMKDEPYLKEQQIGKHENKATVNADWP